MAKNIEDDNYLHNEEAGARGFDNFFDENRQTVLYVVGAIIVVVLAFYAYKKIYLKSLEEDARSAMFVAEQYFERDSFNLAINGKNNDGLLSIIENYSATKSANLAHYYVGVSYLHKGEYDKAIEYLEDFDGGDTPVGILAIGNIGDAYSQKGDYEKAVAYYKDAAAVEDDFTATRFLYKAGLIYEKTGKFNDAVEVYTIIKEKYYSTQLGSQIDKYITRAKLKAGGTE